MTIDVLERLRACRVTDVQTTYDEKTRSTFVEATLAFRCWSGDPNGAAGAMLGDAAQEIIRLRLERDRARQMYCNAMTDHCEEHEARQIAKEQGWDCYKEDGK
jgi:hypothetical protein